MDQVPDPFAHETSTRSQEPSDAGAPVPVPSNPFPNAGLSSAVGLAASNARNIGNAGAAALVVGIAAHMERELQDTKCELKEVRVGLAEMTTKYHDEREKVGVLREQVASGGGIRKLQAICLVVGTALISIAADLYKGGLDVLSYLLGAVGAVLLVVGWFWPIRGAQ